MKLDKSATVGHPIQDVLRERWSPLAYDADRPVDLGTLRSVLEAARWSPSSFNGQPWRFIVGAKPGDAETWEKLHECLIEGNRVWTANVPVLILTVAQKRFEHNGSENRHAGHDTGQAMAHLTFEAYTRGLVMRQMAGFDTARARELFGINGEFEPMTMAAIGYEADSSVLTDTKLRERHEGAFRQRKPLSAIVFGSTFGTSSPLVPDESAT